MSKSLRHALLDLVWASDIDALRKIYRKLEDDPFSAGERETVAVVFNEILHRWMVHFSAQEIHLEQTLF